MGIAFSQQKSYQARTSLEIRMPNDDYLNRRGLDPSLEPGQIMIEPFLQTQMKLAQSESLLLKTAGELGLGKHPEFNTEPGMIQGLMGKKANPDGLTRGQLLERIQGRLTVRLLGQTQVMEILFAANDPRLAAAFVNRLATNYKASVLARRVDATNETETLLGRQLTDMKKALDESESKLQKYVAANSLLPAELGRDSVAEAKLRQLQTSLTSAQEARQAEQTKFELTRQAHADKPAATLESEALRAYRVKLTDLRQKLAEAESIYKPDHYRVKQVKAELEQVERSFEQERDGILVRSRGSLEAARAKELALSADFDAQARKVAAETGQTIHYGTLKSDVETHRQLYASLMQRYRDASVASALQTSSVQVVDPAAPPERPFKPNKPFHLALGLAGGGFAGLLLAFARDRRQKQAHSILEERLAAGLNSGPRGPVPIDSAMLRNLGTVPDGPELDAPLASVMRGIESGDRSKDSASLSFINCEGKAPRTMEQVEAFDGFLGSILGRRAEGAGASVLLLTSAHEGEGRTTIVSNLANAAAAAGKDVLLVDGDSLNPSLHEVFSLPNDYGFSDLLAMDEKQCEASAMGAVWLTKSPGIYVLPAGSLAAQIPVLDRGDRANEIFKQLRQEFDLILVDSPPVLAGAGTVRLARLADDTVMVIRAGGTSESVDEAVRTLRDNQIHVLGAIQNLA